MSEADVQRFLGAHDARLIELERWRGALEAKIDLRLDRLEDRVGAIHEAVTSARGGWRVLAWLAAAAAAVSGIVNALYHLAVK